jgi:hypothetical protein
MVLFERLIHRSGDSACADQTLGAGKPDPPLAAARFRAEHPPPLVRFPSNVVVRKRTNVLFGRIFRVAK